MEVPASCVFQTLVRTSDVYKVRHNLPVNDLTLHFSHAPKIKNKIIANQKKNYGESDLNEGKRNKEHELKRFWKIDDKITIR